MLRVGPPNPRTGPGGLATVENVCSRSVFCSGERRSRVLLALLADLRWVVSLLKIQAVQAL